MNNIKEADGGQKSGGAVLSVIMAVYNCEKTLERAINSILMQSFKDFEFIICDDGSDDNSSAVIKEFAAKDGRIVFLRNKENSGIARSLNICLNHANGKYAARMDADDKAVHTRFEEQIEFLERNPQYDFCGSSIRLFDDSGIWGLRSYPERPRKSDFLFGSPFAHPAVLGKSEAFKIMGGYCESKRVGRSEDYELFMRMYLSGMRGYNIVEPLLYYYEARSSFKKRKFRFAFSESLVRLRGFRALGLLPRGYIYAIKPLVIACVPAPIQIILRRKRYKNRANS